MRNYDYRPDLRHADSDGDEPELQWLEDSINYLVAATFTAVCNLCKLVFLSIRGVFQSFTKTKS